MHSLSFVYCSLAAGLEAPEQQRLGLQAVHDVRVGSGQGAPSQETSSKTQTSRRKEFNY